MGDVNMSINSKLPCQTAMWVARCEVKSHVKKGHGIPDIGLPVTTLTMKTLMILLNPGQCAYQGPLTCRL